MNSVSVKNIIIKSKIDVKVIIEAETSFSNDLLF